MESKERRCGVCSAILVKKKDEAKKRWLKRMFCSLRCSSTAIAINRQRNVMSTNNYLIE